MKKTETNLAEIKLVGITTRTSNAAEMDPKKAQIGSMIQKYFGTGIPNIIEHRKKPGVTFCVYTNYESDFTGEYTYFIGEEVSSFGDLPDNLENLIIPTQDYIKFTNEPGPMPAVCIDMWQSIWQDSELDKTRSYIADFEIYDERSKDLQNTTLDIYVGLKDGNTNYL